MATGHSVGRVRRRLLVLFGLGRTVDDGACGWPVRWWQARRQRRRADQVQTPRRRPMIRTCIGGPTCRECRLIGPGHAATDTEAVTWDMATAE